MPTIDVRDTSLYYEISGDGGVPLLILHGGFAGAWTWEDQMKRLSSDFTCVAYDRRGHSRSEQGREDQSHRTHVEDAAELIQLLGLDRPILVGTSAGGSIAIELMQRYPNLARGAVLSEPGLFSFEPEAEQELRSKLGPAVQRAIDNGRPQDVVEPFFEIMAPNFWSLIDERTRDRLRENAPVFFASLRAEGPTITPDEIAGIHHPVLVIAGTESLPFLRRIARVLAERLPNARLVEFDGSGHATHVEKPDQFTQAVRSLANELTATR